MIRSILKSFRPTGVSDLPHPFRSPEMKGTDIVAIVTGIIVFIFLVLYFHFSKPCGPRSWRRRSTYRTANGKPSTPKSLLPTSAQQTGDASDIRTAPNANIRAFTQKTEVLPPPPPAVMRGIDLGLPVESSTLPPMYMDGSAG